MFANFSASLPANAFPPGPRADDDDDDDEDDPAEKGEKAGPPLALLMQQKFLEQRKIFLWGAVTDASAKDLTEKLLYL